MGDSVLLVQDEISDVLRQRVVIWQRRAFD